jgi:hypothetical protein
MRKHLFILVGFLLLQAGRGVAFLPPDAAAREPQIRAYRVRRQQEYEQHMEARRVETARSYEQARVDIFTPPWVRAGLHAALLTGVDPARAAEEQRKTKRNNRLFASVVLLILAGGAAGWARYATREIETRGE